MLRTLDMVDGLTDTECLICQVPATPAIKERGKTIELSEDQSVFLCEEHVDAFMLGRTVGGLELNSQVANVIAEIDDKATGWNLKEQIYELVPSAQRTVFAAQRLASMGKHTPKSINDQLCTSVVGQKAAKREISLAVYEHLHAVNKTSKSVHSDKHNVLMIGPSGCGKTLIAHAVARALSLPSVSTDATSFSPTGFQGADADSMIHELFQRAHCIPNITEHGVIFIDEIDKLAGHNTTSRGEHLNHNTQSSMIRLIEGKTVKMPSTQAHEMTGTLPPLINTHKILFFAGGAFPGLIDIVGKKMGYNGRKIGLRSDETSGLEAAMRTYELFATAPPEVMIDSLTEYGLAAELIGRFPTIVPLAPLTDEELRECLLDLSDTPIKRQADLFAFNGYQLVFGDDTIDAIIAQAQKMATGTRALNTLVKRAVSHAKFDLCTSTLDKPARAKGKIIITPMSLKKPDEYEIVKKTRTMTA